MRDQAQLKAKIDAVRDDPRAHPRIRKIARDKSEGIKIVLNYKPREYFKPFHARTQRFACIVAHRRAGKTVATLHDLQRAALRNSFDSSKYAYIAPTYSQAKSTAWDYLVEAAAPFFAYGAKINQSDLQVSYPSGAIIRLFGADNYDTLRGLRLDGAVLDEYADIDPRAWTQVIRPALSDRRGFATFIGTPRGHNHFYDIYRGTADNPTGLANPAEWFTACLRASDLVPAHETWAPELASQLAGLSDEEVARFYGERDLLSSIELAQSRRQVSEEEYRQEYECDFESANQGAYYGKQMSAALKDGRITQVPYDPKYQVFTAWDIGGNRDATAIWFAQLVGKGVHLIDYIENRGADSAPYAKAVLGRPYAYAQHFLPHDAESRHPGSELDYKEALEAHGLTRITVLPAGIREHGINAVRLLLPRCYFDEKECDLGCEALKSYQTEWDAKNKVFKATPLHNWASHAADAFRYLAVALDRHVTSPNFGRKLVYPRGF
jgi:phage terminase large subunit